MLKIYSSIIIILFSCATILSTTVIADTVPLPKSIDISEYTIPLYIAPKENGVEFKDYELHYSLAPNDDLDLGGQLIKNDEIDLELLSIEEKNTVYKLKFAWPKTLLSRGGVIELVNPKDNLAFYTIKTPHFEESNYEIKISTEDLKSWKQNIPFRYCMHAVENELKHSFCSKTYILINEEEKFQILNFKEYRKEQKLKASRANKKISMANDQAEISITFYQQGKESQEEAVELPVSDEFMKAKLGEDAIKKNFTLVPSRSKKEKSIKIDKDQYDRNDAQKKMSKWKNKEGFRFCANSICSDVYIMAKTSRTFLIDTIDSKVDNTLLKSLPQDVLIDDKPRDLKGSVTLKKDQKLILKALLGNGGEYHIEVNWPLAEPELFDLIQSHNKKNIIIAGRTIAPLAPNVVKNNDDTWQATLDFKKPFLIFNDPGNTPLVLPLKITKPLLTDFDRLFLKNRTRRGTYRNTVQLHGAFSENSKLKVESTENKVTMTGNNTFDWEFLSQDKATINHRIIKIISNENEIPAFYDIYRGYPYEAVLRLSSLLTDSSKFLIQGELGVAAWLEQFFKWENYRLSVQRWGTSLRYLTTIVDAKNKLGNSVKFTTINFDIKYNIKPGLWNHDQLYGPVLSYQSVNFNATGGNMLGVGGYYGSPMPKVIDNFLNKLKWLKYPKWIDAQFDYYFMPTSKTTVMGRNFNLASHLKIFLKPNFFIEGSLGYRQFDFINQSIFILTQTSFISTSIGAGINF
ncbi:MAG: hypothetical protein SGI74_08825 [Oligoflexia bacterium]|nr:hypothetical protein [Oligoflexia bacterium]